MKRLILLCIAVFAATTYAAAAQSLAEVAKKEKERRAKLDDSDAKTITDVELRRAGGPLTLPSSRTQTPTGSGGEEETDTEAEEEEAPDERQTEAYWRGRLQPINDRIQRLEAELASPLYTNNPVGGPDRQRVEQQLAEARQQRQAILDEARRAGAPPGWLR